MSATITLAAWVAGRVGVTGWVGLTGRHPFSPPGDPPADPFGPVDQDPDVVREEACRLVSSNTRVCSPPEPVEPPKPRDTNVDLSFLSVLLWAVFIAAIGLLLYVLFRWLLSASGPLGRRRDKRSDDDVEVDVVELDAVQIDSSRQPVDWRAEAEQHRLSGRFRDAVRCRYRALVGDLARRGLIDEIPGRTTGEERVQLRAVSPGAAESFDAAANLFDGAWYGRNNVDAAIDDRFQVLERDVLASTPGSRR